MTRRNDSAFNGIGSSFANRRPFVAVVALLGLLAWQLMDLFLVVFGAIIVATALRALASKLEHHLRVPSRWSVLVGLLVVITTLSGFAWAVGDPLAEQLAF
jgi:predicted PurR-regulated permease PerM